MSWTKSSFSGDKRNCVEVYHKSSFSSNGDCVEVADVENGVHVRDSKDRDGSVLSFTESEWTAFIAGVRAGEFDIT